MGDEKQATNPDTTSRKKAPGGGLEGMVAGDSAICFIDGQQGVLRYRGYDISELSAHSTFEEVAWLLWHGELPKAAELKEFSDALGRAMVVTKPVLEIMHVIPKDVHPMAALRTLVSAAAHGDPDAECEPTDRDANLRKATRLLGQIGAITATWERVRKGKTPIAAKPSLSYAANVLFMLTGEAPSETSARVFDECLILHADHEFNASTFTARVIAATLPDLHSALVGAIGALKGPLHGGANTAVMKMLIKIDEQGGAPQAARFIEQALAQKQKIMGFGHRVYKTDDPRATRLKQLSERLARETPAQAKWFDLSLAVGKAVQEQKKLPANVDFFSASTYYVLGIDPDMFTPIFAVSRTSGWIAHVMEQFGNNRLIRPLSNYVGPGARAYVGIGKR
ncbi:MAG: citrate synthase [Polyangiales bacterium]